MPFSLIEYKENIFEFCIKDIVHRKLYVDVISNLNKNLILCISTFSIHPFHRKLHLPSSPNIHPHFI